MSVPVRVEVFKARAVPQGACENLINALDHSANQQKHGDSSVQSIATGLCERIRKGIMEGLRNFLEVDNHSASEVDYLREGTRSFEVRRPRFEEGGAEVSNGIDAENRRSWHRKSVYQC